MSLNNITDKTLVSQYLNGENSSFEILLSRHKSRIFAFIMSKVKNRDLSNDIFQDTFIKVVNSLQKRKYNEEGKFLPWVMRIAHNLVIDHFRKEKKMRMIRSNSDFDIFDVIKDICYVYDLFKAFPNSFAYVFIFFMFLIVTTIV